VVVVSGEWCVVGRMQEMQVEEREESATMDNHRADVGTRFPSWADGTDGTDGRRLGWL